MNITLNGSPKEIADGVAVDELLETLALGPEGVAVELNGELVALAERESVRLVDGDAVELVTLVGGG
jgi:sulfur carrier protein